MIIENRVSNLIDVIKSQTELLEKVNENLYKLEALLHIGMQVDLSDCSKEIVEGFLWTVRDIIIQSHEISQTVLQNFMTVEG